MKKVNSKIKRKIRNRKKLKNINSNKLRITVFKSAKNISAQIIDDKANRTIVSASSNEKGIKNEKKNKTNMSIMIGEILAKRATEKK